jgi:deleted-in-malignant-brain-tumors protein 1
VNVSDCQDGDVRLVGGDGDGDEGTVEVCFANLWGVIGQVGWGLPDAQVVCRQLGFTTTGTVPKYDSYYGRPNKTVHLINVDCDGTEDTINECTKTIITLSIGKTLYKNDSVAGVDCQPEAPTQPSCITLSTPPVTTPAPCIEGSVRLQGGDTSSGRLEYCYNGQYTSFCIVDEKAATVACKNLNFNAYTGASVLNGAFGDLTNVSLVKNISCAGSESQLRQCTINTVDDSCYPYCPGGNIGIRCYSMLY